MKWKSEKEKRMVGIYSLDFWALEYSKETRNIPARGRKKKREQKTKICMRFDYVFNNLRQFVLLCDRDCM